MNTRFCIVIVVLALLAGCRTRQSDDKVSKAPGNHGADSVATYHVAINDSTQADTAYVPAPTFLIQRNICPFEYGCQFTFWVAKEPLAVYSVEGDTIHVAFRTSANDTLIPGIMDMYIEHPGMAIVTRPIESFKPRDTLYVLSYEGEGFFDVWCRGKTYRTYRFWNREGPSDDEAIQVSQVRMSWWVHVRTSTGQEGWLRLLNTEPEGMDFRENIDIHGPMWDVGHGA